MNIWYQCEYCGEIYEIKNKVLACERDALRKKPKFRINQEVMYQGYKSKVIGIQRPYCGAKIVDGELQLEKDKHKNFYYKLVILDPEVDLGERIVEEAQEDHLRTIDNTKRKNN